MSAFNSERSRRVLSLTDKVCLWLGGAVLGVLVLGVLGYVGYVTVENWLEGRAAEVRARAEEERKVVELNLERLKGWEAYWKSPEGQAKKREMNDQAKRQAEMKAVADAEIDKLRWAPWQRVAKAFQEAGFDTLPSTEPRMIRAVVPFESAVRLSSYEIKALCQMAYKALGDGAVVELKDPGGVLLGKADGWNVKAYK